jgi:hypothetical protein
MADNLVWSPSAGRLIKTKTLPTPGAKPKPQHRRDAFVRACGAYAQVPLERWAVKDRRVFLASWLWYQAFRRNSLTFPVSNEALAKYGINRKSKIHFLREFEKREMIAIQRDGRKSLTVTIVI